MSRIASLPSRRWRRWRAARVSAFFRRPRARSGDGVVVRPLEDRLLTYKSGVFVRQENEDPSIRDFLEIVMQRTARYRQRPERNHQE